MLKNIYLLLFTFQFLNSPIYSQGQQPRKVITNEIPYEYKILKGARRTMSRSFNDGDSFLATYPGYITDLSGNIILIYEGILDSLSRDGWSFMPSCDYQIREKINEKSYNVAYDELTYNFLLRRPVIYSTANCSVNNNARICEGTIVLLNGSSGAVRSGGFQIPIYANLDEMDIQLTNQTDASHSFVVYSTKFVKLPDNKNIMIAINAMSIDQKNYPDDKIICKYKIFSRN